MTKSSAKHDPWRIARRLAGLAYELTPQMFAAATFLLGGVMLLSAATPAFNDRLAALGRFSPPLLIDLSHFAASVTGFVLLLISAGLWRRRRGAYYAALAVLLVGAVFSLLRGLDWAQAIELTLAAALLAPCRAAFNRRSRLGEPLRPGWLLMLAAAVAAMLWLGFFAYRDTAYTDELWWTFLIDKQASGFLRAGAVLAVLTLAVAIRSLMTAPGA
ncbi:MAG TPA: GNAT family N-acetyltransferase, partial [Brevundimonas sp.]|nr:GNAT family N-acetyltransferase [Brevundimonas sp.]